MQKMIEVIATAALALAVAAYFGVIWFDRRQRAKFVATLSDGDSARLEGFEERGKWRHFRELLKLERQQAVIRPAPKDLSNPLAH
jgi:hypothetical protein